MASAPAIPGFYYGIMPPILSDSLDSEKRKYFKIEAHGPSSNPYSRDNINKRRKAEQQDAKRHAEICLRTEQHNNLLPLQRWTKAYSVRGYMNAREFGLSQSTEDRTCLQAKLMRRQRVGQIRQSDSALEQLTSFALCEFTGDALLGTQGGLVSAVSTLSQPSNVRMLEPQRTVTWFTSQVTSISLSTTDDSDALVCCSFGNDHSSGTIHFGRFARTDDERHHELDVICVMKPNEKQALFCSTISRFTPGLTAVGAEKVLFVANERGDQLPLVPIKSNCLAVEFLGENTFAAGMRNRFIQYTSLQQG